MQTFLFFPGGITDEIKELLAAACAVVNDPDLRCEDTSNVLDRLETAIMSLKIKLKLSEKNPLDGEEPPRG